MDTPAGAFAPSIWEMSGNPSSNRATAASPRPLYGAGVHTSGWVWSGFGKIGLKTLAGDDDPSQLGAVKVLKIAASGSEGHKASERFEREVTVLRELAHSSILRLLHANVAEHFMVTEYHQQGSLARDLRTFRGDATGALS